MIRALFFCALALVSACAVDRTRSSIPAEAQSAIDRTTEDIVAGRWEKIYTEAADEWRNAATPEQSQSALEHLRERLGRVGTRSFLTGRAQENASGALAGRALVVTYDTTFERGRGMETFTLIERDGRWLLARYFVNSDALRP